MSAAAAQGAFRFHGWNRRAVQACLIGVNDAGLRMRRISQGLTEQPAGRRGNAESTKSMVAPLESMAR